MRGAFTERLGMKAAALALSVLVWLVVGARQPTEGFVDVKVEPDFDSSLVLLGPAPTLRALVAGRAANLVKLYSSPPVVHPALPGRAPDTLVLDVTPSDVHLPPDLSDNVRVLDVQPRRVTLRFEARAARGTRATGDARTGAAGRPR